MSHLDENSNPKIKTSIADVLSKIIALAAGESVGKLIKIINSSNPAGLATDADINNNGLFLWYALFIENMVQHKPML